MRETGPTRKECHLPNEIPAQTKIDVRSYIYTYKQVSRIVWVGYQTWAHLYSQLIFFSYIFMKKQRLSIVSREDVVLILTKRKWKCCFFEKSRICKLHRIYQTFVVFFISNREWTIYCIIIWIKSCIYFLFNWIFLLFWENFWLYLHIWERFYYY